jgi:hypothetical protein
MSASGRTISWPSAVVRADRDRAVGKESGEPSMENLSFAYVIGNH